MKKTLESFIDPANIPKKYGGQLEFHFGDMPVLDPALEKILTWEGGNTDFPHGPMYWVHKEDKPEIEAIARGSTNEKERNEAVCIVKKLLGDNEDKDTRYTNGLAASGLENKILETKAAPAPLPEPESVLLTAPTVPPSPATSTVNLTAAATEEPLPPKEIEQKVVQGEEVIQESRPQLESFVTAQEGFNQLTLAEKTGNVANGSAGPHTTFIANKLDPAVNTDGSKELEDAHVHQEEGNKEAVGGAAEEVDHAYTNGHKERIVRAKVR
jgi:hypothetical protein